jgi:hypothetical protein
VARGWWLDQPDRQLAIPSCYRRASTVDIEDLLFEICVYLRSSASNEVFLSLIDLSAFIGVHRRLTYRICSLKSAFICVHLRPMRFSRP